MRDIHRFIDISAATKKVIFAGTLMGKAKMKTGDGKMTVVEEGAFSKFVDTVGQVTFSGQYSPDTQEVFYVTERCVFKLIDKKMTLIEIAPGIDLKKDILDQIAFTPVIAEDLKEMDPAIFHENWGGLAEIMNQ